MENILVGKILAKMSTTNIHLLQFKIQGHLQKHRLWIMVYELIPIFNITFAILPEVFL